MCWSPHICAGSRKQDRKTKEPQTEPDKSLMDSLWGGQCGLVVDAGFSFTHALPIFDGHLLETGVRRINLGGKLLTNYFKELVSYRSTPTRLSF